MAKLHKFAFRDLNKKYQLIISVTALLFIFSLFLSYLVPTLTKQTLLDNFRDSQEIITGYLADNLYIPLSFSDGTKDIEYVCNSMYQFSKYTHIWVYNTENTLVYKKISEDYPINIQLYHPINNIDDYLDDINELYVTNASIEHNGINYGRIVIIFSTDAIYNEIGTLQYQIFSVCLVLVIIATISTLFISRLILSPLETLVYTFSQVSTGNLSIRSNIDTNEEFGELSNKFNQMVDTLEVIYYDLTLTNQSMEEKVSQKTDELRNQINIRYIAEEKLNKINLKLKSILNASPLPIITLDTNFKILSASPSLSLMFIWKEYEILNNTIPFVTQDRLNDFLNELKQINTNTPIIRIVSKGQRKNGQQLDINCVVSAEFDEDDQILSYIIVVDDITERLLIEKNIKISEAKYRALIEYSNVGISITFENQFIFANQSLLNILDYPSLDEFLVSSVDDIISVDYKEQFYNIIDTLKQNAIIYKKINASIKDNDDDVNSISAATNITNKYELEIQVVCYNGHLKFVAISCSFLILDSIDYIQITFIDISDRKKAEYEMKKLNASLEDKVLDRTSQLNKTMIELRSEMTQGKKMSKELRFKSEILERTTSVCIVFDEFGDCIYLSPWSLLVFEWPIDKLLGENFWTTTELKSIEGVPTYKDDVVAILARESALPADYYTIEITTQSSAKKYLKLKRSLGQQDTLIIAGTEITEQIAYQNELETMSDRLAVSLESEKELNELKTRFISMVSHEFRTPLTVIMSCAAVIEQALNNNRGDIGKKYLTKINASIKTMNNLMEDVLTIGKSSQEIEEFIETDIVKFIKNSIEDIQEAYTFASKMDIVIKEPIYTFYSNETALKHIIHNLITNALKYTTNGKNAVITIEQKEIPNKAEDTMNYIVITIADKGIGIPQKDLQRLFSNFFRASNVGNIQGTGLGLHIVKQSVDNLLGTITVDSTVDVGTTFTVTLPNDVRKLLTS